MQLYLNHLKSGVKAFEFGNDFIKIQFVDGKIYTYSYIKAGTKRVERMKELALKGKGLSTYINQHVKMLYD